MWVSLYEPQTSEPGIKRILQRTNALHWVLILRHNKDSASSLANAVPHTQIHAFSEDTPGGAIPRPHR